MTTGGRSTRAADPVTNEVRRLSTLLEASQALSSTLDLKAASHRVLEILGRHHGAVHGTVVLKDDDGGGFRVDAVEGAAGPARHRPHGGEAVTGHVLQSGRPVIVPRVSREPMFQGRAVRSGARRAASRVWGLPEACLGARRSTGHGACPRSVAVDIRAVGGESPVGG